MQNTIPEEKLRRFEQWVDSNLNASDSRNQQICLWLATLLNAAKTEIEIDLQSTNHNALDSLPNLQ